VISKFRNGLKIITLVVVLAMLSAAVIALHGHLRERSTIDLPPAPPRINEEGLNPRYH
jgi:hypothetical protein